MAALTVTTRDSPAYDTNIKVVTWIGVQGAGQQDKTEVVAGVASKQILVLGGFISSNNAGSGNQRFWTGTDLISYFYLFSGETANIELEPFHCNIGEALSITNSSDATTTNGIIRYKIIDPGEYVVIG